MNYSHYDTILIRFCALLIFLKPLSAQAACSVNSDCTTTFPNSACLNRYCSCVTGYVFDCSTAAISISPQNSALTPLASGRPNYFILDCQIGQYEYTLTFTDVNIANIYTTYQPQVYSDMGLSSFPQVTYRTVSVSNQLNFFTCTLLINITNMFGTQQIQRLVLMISISNSSITPSLFLSYTYTLANRSLSIFLILGYVAGGLLVGITILLMVLIYRKKRNYENAQQKKKEPVQFDLSHFSILMPQSLITPQMKKNMCACSVCLQQFDFNSTIRTTVCQHIFHSDCLDEWCKKNLSCPMCRTELTQENITQLIEQKEKKKDVNDWIMNTLVEQNQGSQIRCPLNNVIPNQQL